MASKPTISLVGPGRLGRVLVEALARSGYPIVELVFRGKPLPKKLPGVPDATDLHSFRDARFDADLIWLCVPDRAISATARALAEAARWKGKFVFHSSGALASDELNGLRRRGASVASVHPLMTFVHGSVPSLSGVPFALEGDAAAARVARKIVRDLGGEAFLISKNKKAAYHAWGTFASPLLIAALVATEMVARKAGLSQSAARQKALPILKQTLANYATLGPAKAFSGPIVRGDAAVVRQHLRSLKAIPEIRALYLALARVALLHLPTRNKKEIERLLP